jgi:BirA family biotin operon repressor/biotin-[acetyl-CoA-carboxylase] ligase
MKDALTPEAVLPRLRGRFGRPYAYRERCASTQRLLDVEAPEGAVAVTEEQTQGRGRLGRRWFAPPQTSILCSILLRPTVAADQLPQLSVVGAEACAEAITERTGLAPEVKFPNDVLLSGRKVAGILGEVHDGRVIVGIGINVNIPPDELPSQVRLPATSLLAELGRHVDRIELFVTLLERLELRYDTWISKAR